MTYAAQIGWLNSSIKQKVGDKEESKSKVEYFGSDSLIVKTPELGELQYIADMWDEVGKAESTGFGISPLKWGEINSYLSLNDCSDWEAKLIQAMSRTFVNAYNVYADQYVEPPYLYGDYTFKELRLMAADSKISQTLSKKS